MPYLDLEKQHLDKLYRKGHLRNSETMNDGMHVDFATPFYSFYDFKRELRGLILVPAIAAFQALEHALHALEDLVVAGVLLATLDERGFTKLVHFFVHTANAIALVLEGVVDTIGTVIALYTRSATTFFDTIVFALDSMIYVVASVFENEPAQQPRRQASGYPTADFADVNPYSRGTAPAANSLYAGVRADLESMPVSSLRANSLFSTPVVAPKAKTTLSEARRGIEQLDGINETMRNQMLADLDAQVVRGEVADDTQYRAYYS
jgi:hypothetical protein